MKTLDLIGGTMGVGKTTVCRILQRRIPGSVFLDGDWCWDANPFQVTEETKAMVMRNICFVLNSFLRCSAYEHIWFCWVMDRQEILDALYSGLELRGCAVRSISLVCREEVLIRRLERDVAAGVRTPEILSQSAARLPLYRELRTEKLDTSDLTPEETADWILASGRENFSGSAL